MSRSSSRSRSSASNSPTGEDRNADDLDATVDVCPHCKSTQWNHRTPGHPMNDIPDDADPYYCWNCETGFQSLAQRPRNGNPGLRGTIAALDEMDPDALPLDGDAP